MEPVFDKVVVLAGTSGVGLSYALEKARTLYGDDAVYAVFEDYVKGIAKAGIYTVATNLLWAPQPALDKFHSAFNSMLSDLVDGARRGARIAFIETHLSYISVHALIPNPILDKIIGLGREATVIYYVDDFYHALLRMAKKIEETPNLFIAESFIIDPLSYLLWRGLDHSLLTMLRAQYPRLEAFIMGAKHPDETHSRLLMYAGKPRARARREYLLAYMSHPITGVRLDYYRLLEKGEIRSMAEHPFIRRFETFKRRLRSRCRNLVLFEPTSIDEVLVPEGKEPEEYVVTRENRWPHPREHDYEDMYPVDIFSKETFGHLYGAAMASIEELQIRTASILDYGGDVRRYYLSRLLQIIADQIEVRDYEYVGQSSVVFAYEPIYKSVVTGQYSPSRGVRKEISRAESQAKAVYVCASEDTVTQFAKETSKIFGERSTPIKLSDPSDPGELVEILREGGFC